jgi:hypothetical protein
VPIGRLFGLYWRETISGPEHETRIGPAARAPAGTSLPEANVGADAMRGKNEDIEK